MPTPGSPVTHSAPPSVRVVLRNDSDAIELRLAPDKIRALTTVARPFVALGDRDLDQEERRRWGRTLYPVRRQCGACAGERQGLPSALRIEVI